MALEPTVPLDRPELQETLLTLRNMWEFCALVQFASFFGNILKIRGADIQIDIDCFEEDICGVNPGKDLLICTENALIASLIDSKWKSEPVDLQIWKIYGRKYRQIGKHQLFEVFGDYSEEEFRFKQNPYSEMDVLDRVKVLCQLTQWIAVDERFRERLEHNGTSLDEFRILPVGWRGDIGSYYLFDDNRLYYKEEHFPDIPNPSSPSRKRTTKIKSKKSNTGRSNRSGRAKQGGRDSKRSTSAYHEDRRLSNGRFSRRSTRLNKEPVSRRRSRRLRVISSESGDDLGGDVEEEEEEEEEENLQDVYDASDVDDDDAEMEIEQERSSENTNLSDLLSVEYEPSWECVCWDLSSWQQFLKKLNRSKDLSEKELYKHLKKNVLPIIEENELSRRTAALSRERHRNKIALVASRKRSSRLEEKLLRQKQEEEERQKREAEERQLERARLREKQLMEIEKARENRLLERQERERLRRQKLLEVQQQKQQLSSAGSRRSSRAADLAKKHLEEEDQNWIFDCMCGVYGENYDDGTMIVECDNCHTWMHVDCLPETDRKNVLAQLAAEQEEEEKKNSKEQNEEKGQELKETNPGHNSTREENSNENKNENDNKNDRNENRNESNNRNENDNAKISVEDGEILAKTERGVEAASLIKTKTEEKADFQKLVHDIPFMPNHNNDTQAISQNKIIHVVAQTQELDQGVLGSRGIDTEQETINGKQQRQSSLLTEKDDSVYSKEPSDAKINSKIDNVADSSNFTSQDIVSASSKNATSVTKGEFKFVCPGCRYRAKKKAELERKAASSVIRKGSSKPGEKKRGRGRPPKSAASTTSSNKTTSSVANDCHPQTPRKKRRKDASFSTDGERSPNLSVTNTKDQPPLHLQRRQQSPDIETNLEGARQWELDRNKLQHRLDTGLEMMLESINPPQLIQHSIPYKAMQFEWRWMSRSKLVKNDYNDQHDNSGHVQSSSSSLPKPLDSHVAVAAVSHKPGSGLTVNQLLN